MAKFCANCGNQMMDNAVVCPACGAPAEVQETAAPAATNPVVAAIKKVNPKYLKLGGIAVAAVAVITIVLVLIFGSSPKKALNNYLDYTLKTNVNKVESLAPKAYWNFCKESGLIDIKDKDEVKACNEDYLDGQKEELEDEYGAKIKYSYKITKEKDVKNKDLTEIKEYLKKVYDIPKKDVKDAKEIDIEIKISGKDDNEEIDMDSIIVVKIGGGWYVLTNDSKLGLGFADYDYEYDWEAYADYLADKADDEEDDD